jgi:1,4-alpha-glucan branching enzyme
MRRGHDAGEVAIVACNFTPVARHEFRIGVPAANAYVEVLNSDAKIYGGGDVGNAGRAAVEPVAANGYEQSISLTLPPLGAIVLVPS